MPLPVSTHDGVKYILQLLPTTFEESGQTHFVLQHYIVGAHTRNLLSEFGRAYRIKTKK